MRIAIDATFRMHGGGMIHLRHLLAAWRRLGVDGEHRLLVFSRPENVDELGPFGSGIEVVPATDHVMSSAARLLWQQLKLPALTKHMAVDVLFCPGGVSPLRPLVPTVVAFRNAAPFSDAVGPRTAGFQHWAWFKALGAMMRLSAKRADRVVFVSNYFRDLFVHRFGFPSERADVIYHGSDGLCEGEHDPGLLRELGVRPPFILSVSHLYRYKNIPALIEGYALARQPAQARGLRLVIVGKVIDRSHYYFMRRRIEQLGLQDWVLLPGPVPHQKISTLLAECHSFMFQSTCENCPNTLIEALAAGVPVASSDAGVMPEIGGDAVLYFNPFQPSTIADAIVRLAEDAELRRQMAERARRAAARFPTWDQVGDLTLKSLERAVKPAPAAATAVRLPSSS